MINSNQIRYWSTIFVSQINQIWLGCIPLFIYYTSKEYNSIKKFFSWKKILVCFKRRILSFSEFRFYFHCALLSQFCFEKFWLQFEFQIYSNSPLPVASLQFSSGNFQVYPSSPPRFGLSSLLRVQPLSRI